MSTWISLGSSPTTPQGLRRAMLEHEYDYLITTNAGILLEPQPTHLFLLDDKSVTEHHVAFNAAQDNGALLVTFEGGQAPNMLTLGIREFDEYHVRSPKDIHEFEPRQYPCKGHSGMYATQYACVKGATTVVMAGHDGYAPGKPDHWYEDQCRNWIDLRRSEVLKNYYGPFYRRLAMLWSDVEFIQYGKPNFGVDSPNWTVIEVE